MNQCKFQKTLQNGPESQKRTSGSQERSSARILHNFLITKAMKAHEDLLERLSSLFSNESSGDQFRYFILPADQN